VKRREIDTKQLGCAGLVTAGPLERGLNQMNFKLAHFFGQTDSAPKIDRTNEFERFDFFD
jgi:hypothetical protein